MTAEDSTGIGCASRGKPLKNAFRSSCSRVWRLILLGEVGQLGLGRQLPVDQQVADLQPRGVLRELVDGVAAVAQDARVAVDVGDGRAARRGVAEAGVERHESGAGQQLADVDRRRPLRRRPDRHLLVAAGQVEDGGLIGSHRGGSLTLGWAGFRSHASARRAVCARSGLTSRAHGSARTRGTWPRPPPRRRSRRHHRPSWPRRGRRGRPPSRARGRPPAGRPRRRP